jgi:hypothetical protein
MATPVGHSIVGYTIARAAGVSSRGGLALAVGAASLPDVDFLLGYVAHGDFYSLHRGVITHKPAFPLLVGLATGAVAAIAALRRGRRPRLPDVLRPAALATALVGSHVVMDRLPVPYTSEVARSGRSAELIALHGWNMVVDITVYGALAALALARTARAANA